MYVIMTKKTAHFDKDHPSSCQKWRIISVPHFKLFGAFLVQALEFKFYVLSTLTSKLAVFRPQNRVFDSKNGIFDSKILFWVRV